MLHCKKCTKEINITDILHEAKYSWPQLQTIWFECNTCNSGNHIRIQNGLIQIIEILSAPGVEWEIIESKYLHGISFRIDPELLHIWYQNEHFEFKSKN